MLRKHPLLARTTHCCETREADSSSVSSNSKDSSSFRQKNTRRISKVMVPRAPAATHPKIRNGDILAVSSDTANTHSNNGRVEEEVFLRNPKTGGFDYTPAQHDYQNYDSRVRKKKKEPLRPFAVDAEGGVHYGDSDDETTLNDSTVYTSFTRKPLLPKKQREQLQMEQVHESTTKNKPKKKNPLQSLLSPRSRNSFNKYYQNKASKTPNPTLYSPPEGGAARATIPVTPSPKPKRESLLQKMKCRVTGPCSPTHRPAVVSQTPDERKDEDRHHNISETSSSDDYVQYIKAQVEPAKNTHLIMSSPSRRKPVEAALVVTPPRSGRSPRKMMLEEDVSDASFLNPKSSPAAESPSLAASSCLDFSFSTFGNNTTTNGTKKEDDSLWTFDAISPVALCGGTPDDAESVEICTFWGDSGFEADLDKTADNYNDDVSTILDASVLHQDNLSLQSSGALLLTEEGLKRHNDKKLEQEKIEPLTLRQPNGVGKLEKEVLKQKVERLQRKEVKKQAETSLEAEREERKRRHKERLRQSKLEHAAAISDSEGEGEEVGHYERDTTPEKRKSPPRSPKTPNSMSPQTSLGQRSPSGKKLQSGLTKSWSLSNVLPWKKKPSPEELKRQWKERERERVQRAQEEKAKAERLEQERIEELRKSYLQKQRQLEAAALSSKVINTIDVDDFVGAEFVKVVDVDELDNSIDVDELMEARRLNWSGKERDNHHEDMTVRASARLDGYVVSCEKDSSDPCTIHESFGDLGSATTMTAGLGPCIVCNARERTHIAMPCMHFAFCGPCVQSHTMCPVCTMENVSFSRVNTE